MSGFGRQGRRAGEGPAAGPKSGSARRGGSAPPPACDSASGTAGGRPGRPPQPRVSVQLRIGEQHDRPASAAADRGSRARSRRAYPGTGSSRRPVRSGPDPRRHSTRHAPAPDCPRRPPAPAIPPPPGWRCGSRRPGQGPAKAAPGRRSGRGRRRGRPARRRRSSSGGLQRERPSDGSRQRRQGLSSSEDGRRRPRGSTPARSPSPRARSRRSPGRRRRRRARSRRPPCVLHGERRLLAGEAEIQQPAPDRDLLRRDPLGGDRRRGLPPQLVEPAGEPVPGTRSSGSSTCRWAKRSTTAAPSPSAESRPGVRRHQDAARSPAARPRRRRAGPRRRRRRPARGPPGS